MTSITASATIRAGIEALAEASRPILEVKTASGVISIFPPSSTDALEGYAPRVSASSSPIRDIRDDRSPEQWQQDAFGQVDAWLKALGLR